MKTLTLKSPAKINLFLHITGKRPDGYHNLQTVFRLIDFYDDMQFCVRRKGEKNLPNTNLSYIAPIYLETNPVITQNPVDNLVIKAAQALYDFAKENNILTANQLANLPFIDIQLKKNIPIGAGLGGGSSNCATTLLALNQLWSLQLSKAQLQAIGATLGADVPIFIFGRDAIAEGIGEILTPLDLPPQRLLLLTPNAHINTAKIFAHPALRRDCSPISHNTLLTEKADFLDNLSPNFSNVFEPVVIGLSSEVNTALTYLHAVATSTQSVPRMSGSGSSLFLPISPNFTNQQIDTWLKDAPCPTYVVHTLPNG